MSEAESGQDEKFPLSEFASRLEEAIERLDKPVRFRAKNAFLHLHRAWRLKSLDQGMAAFRAITAEEEAATALIVALKRKKYANADKLNAWNHDHKSSIFFLMQVISGVLAKTGYTPQVYFADKDDPPRFRIQLDVHKLAGTASEEPLFAEPVLPLDFIISDKDGPKNFASEFAEFTSERGHKRVRDYLKSEANLRNRILYAADNGIPKVEIPDEFIIDRKNRVAAILSIVVMIEQADEIQSFAQQSLHALLQVLDKLEGEAPSPPDVKPPQPIQLQIERTPNTSRMDVLKDGKTQNALFEYTRNVEFKVRWLDPWVI